MLFEVALLFACGTKSTQLFQNSRAVPQNKASLLRTFYKILETSLGFTHPQAALEAATRHSQAR